MSSLIGYNFMPFVLTHPHHGFLIAWITEELQENEMAMSICINGYNDQGISVFSRFFEYQEGVDLNFKKLSVHDSRSFSIFEVCQLKVEENFFFSTLRENVNFFNKTQKSFSGKEFNFCHPLFRQCKIFDLVTQVGNKSQDHLMVTQILGFPSQVLSFDFISNSQLFSKQIDFGMFIDDVKVIKAIFGQVDIVIISRKGTKSLIQFAKLDNFIPSIKTLVSLENNSNCRHLAVTTLNGENEAVIIWEQKNDTNITQIYGQRIFLNGTLNGHIFLINGRLLGNRHQIQPYVTSLLEKGFVVTWAGQRENGTFGIFVKVYNNIREPHTRSVCMHETPQTDPKVAVLKTGDIIIVWSGRQGNDLRPQIYAKRFDFQGQSSHFEWIHRRYIDKL